MPPAQPLLPRVALSPAASDVSAAKRVSIIRAKQNAAGRNAQQPPSCCQCRRGNGAGGVSRLCGGGWREHGPFGASKVAWPRGERIALHATPGARRLLATVTARTPFGSPTALAVVGERAGWLAVISDALGNGVRSWVRASTVRVSHNPFSLEVDLSRRRRPSGGRAWSSAAWRSRSAERVTFGS